MTTPTRPIPETPTITSKADLKGKGRDVTPLQLPSGEAESSNSSPGTTSFIPTTAAEILAQENAGFDFTANIPLPPSAVPSNRNSQASSSTAAPSPIAMAAPTRAPELMEKKPQESEDPEAKAWYERYVKAQPNGPLKTTDYHHVQIMSRWREDQKVLDRKKEDAAKAAEANGKKQKRRKRFILF
jgi:hypothetical protein